jgi:hypothetical protein
VEESESRRMAETQAGMEETLSGKVQCSCCGTLRLEDREIETAALLFEMREGMQT